MRNARTLLVMERELSLDTTNDDTHAHFSTLILPLALISVLSFCGVLSASLFIHLGVVEKSSAGASYTPTPRKEDDREDTCDGTNSPLGAGPQGRMHTSRLSPFRFSRLRPPPSLCCLLLISTVRSTTAFSQARLVHAQALLGAGRDNSAHNEHSDDGKLLLLPAELLVYW